MSKKQFGWFERWEALYDKYENIEPTYATSKELQKEFSELSNEWLNTFTKEVLIDNLDGIFMDIHSLDNLKTGEDFYESFLDRLYYCSDRMCISRYVGMTIQLSNAVNLLYIKEGIGLQWNENFIRKYKRRG